MCADHNRYIFQLPGDTVVSPAAVGAMHAVVHWGPASHHIAWNSMTTTGSYASPTIIIWLYIYAYGMCTYMYQ